MDDEQFGPVELVLAEFTGDRPSGPVFDALQELSDAGTIRLIDLVHITKDESDVVSFTEVADVGDGPVDLAASGLVSDEDVEELGAMLPAGASALLLVVELLWAKKLASRLFEAGGAVVDSIRIPAPVVNLVAQEAARVGQEQEVG
jgi:uncharacterized membrane protein